jgi:hypothetical protein
LELDINQVTPAKRKDYDKLFERHEQHELYEVVTMSTGPRSKFAKELALMKSAAEDEAYRAANMTANKQPQFPIPISNGETEATTWLMADTERVTDQLEREIYGITSNEHKRCKHELSICLIEFEAS